jgi:hypothetical protein
MFGKFFDLIGILSATWIGFVRLTLTPWDKPSFMVLWLSYLIASQKPGVRTFLGSKQKLTNSKVVSEVFPKYLSVSNTDKQIGFPSFLTDDPKEPCVMANLGKVSQPEWDKWTF